MNDAGSINTVINVIPVDIKLIINQKMNKNEISVKETCMLYIS